MLEFAALLLVTQIIQVVVHPANFIKHIGALALSPALTIFVLHIFVQIREALLCFVSELLSTHAALLYEALLILSSIIKLSVESCYLSG